MIRHLTASAVVIDPETESVLLVWHKASQRWMFPGGHVDAGESPAEAALREVHEETQVVATLAGHRMDLPGQVWQPSPFLTAEIPAPAKPERPGKPAEDAHSHVDQLFLATADSSAALSPAVQEVSAVRWFGVAELLDLLPHARAEVPDVADFALALLYREYRPTTEGDQH